MRHARRSRTFIRHATSLLGKAAKRSARQVPPRLPRQGRRLQLESLESRQLLTVIVDRMELFRDTGPSNWDRVTTDPTLVGHVTGDATTGHLRLEFDHNGDGTAEGHAEVAADQTVFYDPRQFDSQFQDRSGPVTIQFRPVRLNDSGQLIGQGSWMPFYFSLQAPPPSDYRLTDLGLAHDTGSSATDGRTTDPTLVGRVLPASTGPGPLTQVLVQFDHNGDGNAEATVSTGDGDRLLYSPSGLLPGPHTIAARPLQWDADSQAYRKGSWSSLTFHLEATPVADFADLRIEAAAAADAVGVTEANHFEDLLSGGVLLTGRLVGTADQIAQQEVQLDLDGDQREDATTSTDSLGDFAYRILTPVAGSITVRARATHFAPRSSLLTLGDWVAITTDVRPSVQPDVANLRPAAGSRDDLGRWTSDSAAVAGQLLGAVPGKPAYTEWDYDGDRLPDAVASVDTAGQFLHQAVSAEPGELNWGVRGVIWDERLSAFHPGPWTEFRFTLSEPAELSLLTPELALRHETGDGGDDLRTTDPTVVGTVGQGSTGAFLTLELDFNGDGRADDTTTSDAEGRFEFWPAVSEPGTVTVQARARQWDYTRQEGRWGDWSRLTYALLPLQATPPRVERLVLASDSGSSQQDGVTANRLVRGVVSSPPARIGPDGSGILVEFDHDQDQVVDGQALVASDGTFFYEPESLGDGPHVLQARAVQWDPFQQTDVAGPWHALSFAIESQPAAPAQITQLGTVPEVVNGVVREPSIQGQIVNENSLHAVTIELDLDGDGRADQTTRTDMLGQFEIRPLGLATGPVELHLRPRELAADTGQLTYGSWVSLSFTNEPAQPTGVAVSWLGLAQDTGSASDDGRTWDPAIQGRLDQGGHGADVTVQLDTDGDGIVDATVQPDSQGWFTHEPTGLRPGSVTIQARTRLESARQVAVHGAWQALHFELEAPPSTGPFIERLELARDTGNSAVDGSTDDPTLQGQAGGIGFAGTVVVFDFNGDGQAEGQSALDAQGRFRFSPEPLQPGLVTVRARLTSAGSDSAGSDSAAAGGETETTWTTLTFVYASDPDSATAQTLVGSRTEYAVALSEARRRLDETLAAGDLQRDRARQDALLQHDQRVGDAVDERQRAVAAAELAYRSAQQASEEAYVRAVQEAGNRLLEATDQTSGELGDVTDRPFAWPSAPDSALEFPSPEAFATEHPVPLLEPREWFADRPDYDLQQDQVHRRQVAAATNVYDQAMRGVERQLVGEREQAAREYQQSLNAAQQQYLRQLRLAQTARQQSRDAAVSPIDTAVVDQQHQTRQQDAEQVYQEAKRQHGEDYQNAIRAAQATEAEQVAAAIRAYDQGNAAAGQRYLPEIGNPYATPEQREQSRQTYIGILAENEVIKATAIADANLRFQDVLADEGQRLAERDALARLEYDRAVYESQRIWSEQMADARQWQRTTDEQVEDQFRAAVALAEKRRAEAMNTAQRQFVEALAGAEARRQQDMATAERDRDQAIAASRTQATQALRAFDPGPWSDYQAALAAHHAQFVAEQGQAARRYVEAVTSANVRQATATAEGLQTHGNSELTATWRRDVAHSTHLREYRQSEAATERDREVQEAHVWQQRQNGYAAAEANVQQELAVHQRELARQSARADRQLKIAKGHIEADKLRLYEPVKHARDLATAEHARNVAVAYAVQAKSEASIAARQADDERRAEATRLYEADYHQVQQDSWSRLLDASDLHEQRRATADRDYRLARATAAGVLDNQTARLEADWRSALAAAESLLGELSAAADRTRLVADRSAESAAEIATAQHQRDRLARSNGLLPAAWIEYQLDVAQSQLERLVAVGDALIQRVGAVADAQVSWVHDTGLAAVELAELLGTAQVVQVASVVSAMDVLAGSSGAAQLTYDLLASQRTTLHNQNVVATDRQLEDALAGERARLARELARAGRGYEQEQASALLQRELAIQDAVLQNRLGQLGPGQYDALVQAAHNQYAERLEVAGRLRRQLEAAAEETRANAEAVARQDWTAEVGEHTVTWADAMGSASVVLATALDEAAVAFAQTEAQAGLGFATDSAAAVRQFQVATTNADAQRRNGLAQADAGLDVALVASNWAAQGRELAARNARQLAELNQLVSYRQGQAAEGQVAETASKLAIYRQAIAESRLVWAQDAGAAYETYHRATADSSLAHATSINSADQLHVLATANADVAVHSGMAAALENRTVAYGSSVAERTVAESQALLKQGASRAATGRHYQTRVAQARRAYAVRVAAARTAWVAAIARAEAERYVGGDGPGSDESYRAAEAAADAAFQAAEREARIILAGDLGDADIARARELGDALVERIAAFGDASLTFTQNAGAATTTYTARATGLEESWVQASSLAQTNFKRGIMAAELSQTGASAAATIDLQAQLGRAHVRQAASHAHSETDFAIALAERQVAVTLSAGDDSPSSLNPEGSPLTISYRHAEQAAYVGWLTDLADDYRDFTVTTAQADADHIIELTAAAASLDRVRAVADAVLVRQRAALDLTRDSNRVAVWGAYERELVELENLVRENAEAADGALDQAYGEAARQLAIDLATARRARDVAVASDDPAATLRFTAAVGAAEALQEIARADATVTWTEQVAAAETRFATDHSTSALALDSALTGLNQRYAVELAADVSRHQTSQAVAEADYAVAEIAAIGYQRQTLAAAGAEFLAAQLVEENQARTNLDATLATSASQFRAELAAARNAWWQGQQPVLSGWFHQVHAAHADYQQSVANAYEERTAAAGAAGVVWVTAAADAQATARLAASAADHAYLLAHEAASLDYAIGLATATRQRQVELATAKRDLAGGGSADAYQAAIQSAQQTFDASRQRVFHDFGLVQLAARGRRDIARAQADAVFTAASTAADLRYASESSTIDQAFLLAELTAHGFRRDTLADLYGDYRQSAVDSWFQQLDSRADATGSPGFRHQADQVAAEQQKIAASVAIDRQIATLLVDTEDDFFQRWNASVGTLERQQVEAEGQRNIMDADARSEHTEQTAAAAEGSPQAALTEIAAPRIPRPAPAVPEPILGPDQDGATGPSVESDSRPALPLFTGPGQPFRLTESRLGQGRIQAADPTAASEEEPRHRPHLVANLPSAIRTQREVSERNTAAGSVVASRGQLLALANVPLALDAQGPANLHSVASRQLLISQLALRDAPDPANFRRFEDWLEAERAYQQHLGRDVMQASTDAQRRTWFALRQEVAEDHFDRSRPAHGSIGAPASPDEFDRQVSESYFQSLGFWERRQTLRHWAETTDQVRFGEYTNDFTAEGVTAEIALSLTGVDAPLDLRDLSYQLSHWEWSWSHAGKTGLYTVSLLPLVGVVKNLKHVEHLKHVDQTASLSRQLSRAAGGLPVDEVGQGLGQVADDSQRILLDLSGNSCFVAGTRVVVAVATEDWAAEDWAMEPASEFDQQRVAGAVGLLDAFGVPGLPWKRWTSRVLMGAGAGLALWLVLRRLPEPLNRLLATGLTPAFDRQVPGRRRLGTRPLILRMRGHEFDCGLPARLNR